MRENSSHHHLGAGARTRRLAKALAALPLLIGALGLTGPLPGTADGSDFAYCPYGSVNGTGSWNPGVGPMPSIQNFVWTLTADCEDGDPSSDELGTYGLTFNGSSNENCAVNKSADGSGSGTFSGSHTTEGTVSQGNFTFYKIGIHYYVSGTYLTSNDGGEPHRLQFWLDVIPPSTQACSYTQASIIGHGLTVDNL
jgi:hypothetical protein